MEARNSFLERFDNMPEKMTSEGQSSGVEHHKKTKTWLYKTQATWVSQFCVVKMKL